jgi:telomerase reverse transcriptase
VTWLLFKRHATSHRPSHLLCHGFQRASPNGESNLQLNAPACIPGIVSQHPNSYAETLKSPVWCRLHALLGPGGDRIMMELLLYCGLFCAVEGNPGNYFQLCGTSHMYSIAHLHHLTAAGHPISELKPLPTGPPQGAAVSHDESKPRPNSSTAIEPRKPSAITFVRSRMLYARAALNGKGGARFGMRHIRRCTRLRPLHAPTETSPDVLNRFPDRQDHSQTIHIMKYIFPRQFGLHNVFMSKVDARETAMPCKDYTLREQEIKQVLMKACARKGASSEEIEKWKSHLPKRLRGDAVALVDKLRTLNQRCSYFELLRHYCPVEVSMEIIAVPL